MKYVILPPQASPKQETVHHRPKTLGEMKLAFLNANNRKDWADDQVEPTVLVPPSRAFTSRKKFVIALNEQKRLLMRRERDRFLETLHTVPSIVDIWRRDTGLDSRSAASLLMHATSPLQFAEYFARRTELQLKTMRIIEADTFVNSPDISEVIALTFAKDLERKHIFSTRVDFMYRDLTDK